MGYPVPEAQDTGLVDASSACIDLTGGSWGDGRLVRDVVAGEWSWEPAVRFDLRMSRAATTWTGGTHPQMLRLRAVAKLPWAARVHELGTAPVSAARARKTAVAQRPRGLHRETRRRRRCGSAAQRVDPRPAP